MPELANHGGDGGVLPRGLLCYKRRKRPRHASPFSVDALPDEVLSEILRRLPGNRERSISACVSKRWLMLLSGIRASELSLEEEETRKHSARQPLTRCLQGRVTDVWVAAVAVGTAGCGRLGNLAISGSDPLDPGLTDLGLSAVARCCPYLKVLSIRNAPNINDDGLAELASGCPMIEQLDLGLCPRVTGKGLLAMPEKFPNLVSIVLDSCVSFVNEGLQAIGCCSSNLESVSIMDCPLIGDQGIAALMCSATSSLDVLKLQNLNVGDRALGCIGRYGKAVTHLCLIGLQNAEHGFWRMWPMGNDMGLQKLKSVAVTACRWVTIVSLMNMAMGCPELKELCLCRCCDMSDANLKGFVKSAHALENLQLEECDGITLVGVLACLVDHNTRIKTLGLVKCLGIKDICLYRDILPKCKSLQTLTVHDCPGFTGANLADVGRICRNLINLDLGDLVGMTDDRFLPVIWTNALVKVNLQGCTNLTDSAICVLVVEQCWNLQVLNLDGCYRLTDRVLLEISKNCTELKQLDMSGADITDYGVALLASARLLKVSVLSFAGCAKLTPRCLPLLGNMGPTLVRLNLQNCDLISADDISCIEEDMDWCDINLVGKKECGAEMAA